MKSDYSGTHTMEESLQLWLKSLPLSSLAMHGRWSTLIHGDSRKLVASLPPKSIGCIVTSPPYGDQKFYGTAGEVGDGKYADFKAELTGLLLSLRSAAKDGAAFWLVLDSIKRAGSDVPLPWDLLSTAIEAGWRLQDTVVWDKGRTLPWSHRGHFRSVSEHIFLLSNGPLAVFDLNAARETEQLSPYWVKYPERFSPAGKAPSDIWHFPTPVQGSWSPNGVRHLCPFPVGLVARMLSLTTRPGDVVLDPFAGSGSVLATAEHLGRIGVGIELNRRYFEGFAESGSSNLALIVKRELPTTRNRSGKTLATTIARLRGLKSARTLVSELSRPDRIGAEARDQILAVLAIIAKGTDSGQPRWRVRLVLVVRRAQSIKRLLDASRAVVHNPPLSKFGVDFTEVEVVSARSLRRHATLTGDRFFQYALASWQWYKKRVDRSELLQTIAGELGKPRERSPLLYSNCGLRIALPLG